MGVKSDKSLPMSGSTDHTHRVSRPGPGEPGKVCRTCGEYWTLGSYHRYKARPDGLKGRCKDCIWEYQSSHPEIMRRSRRKSRERSQLREAGVTMSDADKLVDHFILTGEELTIVEEPVSADAFRRFLEGDE